MTMDDHMGTDDNGSVVEERSHHGDPVRYPLTSTSQDLNIAKDLHLASLKDVVKHKKRELRKFIELQYGLLDHLVSQGTCDLEQVKVIEDTESSIKHRKKIVKELVKKLSPESVHRENILELMKMNNQHHVAEFIEHEGHPSDVAQFKPLDTLRKSKITRNMRNFIETLDPDNGLVQEWLSKGCISYQQYRDIEETSPQYRRKRKLMNILFKRSVADYDLFVDCLKNNDQEHLAELLEISQQQEDVITESVSRNWRVELDDLLEVNLPLVDGLMSLGLLKHEDRVDDLEAKSPSPVQRGRLLDLTIKQSPTGITQFLDALRSTGQEHVANFITRNGCRYASDDELYKRWPLDSQYESRITRNFCELMRLIKADVFSTTLYSAVCINSLQKCDVDETLIEYDKAGKLLNFLLQSSIANYEDFVECLKKTKQRLVAKILETRVEVVSFDYITANGARQEQEIFDRWKEVFSNNNSQKIDEIDSVLHKRVGPGVEIVDIQPGSVRCYLLCRTPTALITLYEKLENGSLTVTMQHIFKLLLGGEDTVQVEQTKGRLSASELQRRVKVFSKDLESSIILPLTRNDAAPGESESRDLIAELLEQPEDMWSTYDVLEPILLQVAVKLFKVNRLRLLLPHPDVTTLITVNSVCRNWWEVITGRKILRRRLKLTFRKSTVLPVELFKAAVLQRHRLVDVPHKTSRDADVIVLQSLASLCRRWKTAFSESGDLRRRRLKRLFHYNPQLLFTLDQQPTDSYGDPRAVFGLVTLDKYLYVVYRSYNKVQVFDCEDRFKKIKDIEVKEIISTWDMVSSSVTSQLFISDENSDVIWRVDLKTGVSDVFVKTGYKDMRLSLVENRLLVTSRVLLFMFDIFSGERIKTIPIPLTEDIKGYVVHHAIESNRDSFFVSYDTSDSGTVCEIDSEGRVIRVFDNKQQLDCVYLALDSVSRLLAADEQNKQVVLFDEHLRYERILIDNKRLDNAGPTTLNYNKNNNRLMVGLNNGHVKMFDY